MKKIVKNILAFVLGKNNTSTIFSWIEETKYNLKYALFTILVNQKKREDILNRIAFRVFSEKSKNVFFGYYDKTPFNNDDTKILALSTPNNYNAAYNGKDKANILLIDVSTGRRTKISETETWNWQQGCRLQWHPIDKNKILYNKLFNNKYGSEIYDIEQKKVCGNFDIPIYDITSDGHYIIFLNFSRLQRLRKGYGYSNLPDETVTQKNPISDGVYLYNTQEKEKYLAVSLKYLSELEPQKSMHEAGHYINHISSNPFNPKVFLFFHLWKRDKKMMSRAVIYNIESKKINLLTNEEFVSHYAWKSEEELLLFSKHKKTGTKYHLYNIETGNRKVIGALNLNKDGHPSFFQNKPLLLTDTYPDEIYYQKLIIFNYEKEKIELVYKIPTYITKNRDYRCDLHPRLSHSNKFISIDSSFNKERNIIILKLEI